MLLTLNCVAQISSVWEEEWWVCFVWRAPFYPGRAWMMKKEVTHDPTKDLGVQRVNQSVSFCLLFTDF